MPFHRPDTATPLPGSVPGAHAPLPRPTSIPHSRLPREIESPEWRHKVAGPALAHYRLSATNLPDEPIIVWPFYVAWHVLELLAQCFVYSTSRRQAPAYTARLLTRQGRYADAGAWYVEMLLSKGYSELIWKSVLGPRGNEAVKFYTTHGHELPEDLRAVLGDLLWSYSFLQEDLPHMSELGKDGPPIIDLAEKLVAHAFAPKDSFKITKIANWVFT